MTARSEAIAMLESVSKGYVLIGGELLPIHDHVDLVEELLLSRRTPEDWEELETKCEGLTEDADELRDENNKLASVLADARSDNRTLSDEVDTLANENERLKSKAEPGLRILLVELTGNARTIAGLRADVERMQGIIYGLQIKARPCK